RFQPGTVAGGGPPDPLADRPDPAVPLGEQGDDPVRLAQLVDAQHHGFVTVERHRSMVSETTDSRRSTGRARARTGGDSLQRSRSCWPAPRAQVAPRSGVAGGRPSNSKLLSESIPQSVAHDLSRRSRIACALLI